MKKTGYTALVFLSVLVVGVAGFYVLNKPPSIEYLKEYPEEFRFEDFASKELLHEAVSSLFAEGSRRSLVEEYLISKRGFDKSLGISNDQGYIVIYSDPNLPNEASLKQGIKITYQKDNDLVRTVKILAWDQKSHYWFPVNAQLSKTTEAKLNQAFPVGSSKADLDKVFLENKGLYSSVPLRIRNISGQNTNSYRLFYADMDTYFSSKKADTLILVVEYDSSDRLAKEIKTMKFGYNNEGLIPITKILQNKENNFKNLPKSPAKVDMHKEREND